MLILTTIITIIYTLLIGAFIFGFNQIKTFKQKNTSPITKFTIVIPFRNEAGNLPNLLKSISKLKYPTSLFEVILINDDSTDDGIKIITSFKEEHPTLQVQVKNNRHKSKSPKKDAIETAIKRSNFDWIITTDADCIVPENWLQLFNDFIYHNNPKMICASVTYHVKNTFLEQFQLLDFMSLIGVTIGGFGLKKPFLCNGANLCYSKQFFFDVNGFEGNNTISSGDDIFLMEKFLQKSPNNVQFLKSKEAIIITKPENKLQNLIHQRVRWASKTSATKNIFAKIVGSIVLLMNLTIIFLIIYSCYTATLTNTLLWIFSFKIFLDFIIIYKTLLFTQQSKNIFTYPFIVIIYPFFTIYIVILSIFKKRISWKNRVISN